MDAWTDDELFARCYALADAWGVSAEKREHCGQFIARAVGLARDAAWTGNADIVTATRLVDDFERSTAPVKPG